MKYEGERLSNLLRDARRRRRLMLVLRGAAVCLGAAAAILLMTGWAAHRFSYSEGALVVLRLGALGAFAVTLYLALARPLVRRIDDARLARLIEERTPAAQDRFVTAVEFAAAERERLVSRALVERLRSDANGVAAGVNLDRVFSRRRLAAYGGVALACLLLFAGVLKWGPRGVSEGVSQLVTPSGLAASEGALSIKVKPGTARVPKGSDQEITATLGGFDSGAVTFFSRTAGAGGDAGWQGQPMEPAKAPGDFQLSIFNIQEATEYFVESGGVRSEVFKLDVVDLPFVKQLDLVLNSPAYTRIAAKTIEDGGDIAALKGTVAIITARLSGKARAARLVLADGSKIEMRAAGTDFVGALTVSGDTSYYVELTSVDGEVYRGSNEYDVTVLEDRPPTIAFERPGRDTKATNLEEVFTQARAEDDYGVAGIEMFFSVNGGPEQKVNLQDLSRDAARSLTGAHTFFLEEYKLKPGDFISYYAKARDASAETTSDIYFIEVKPFEMRYKQAQQQGGGGGGDESGDQDQNALTRRQKELIAATHRLTREGQRYSPQERADSYETVAAGQEKLRADTLEFIDRLGRRLGEQMEGRDELARMAEHLREAAREMDGAPPPLRKQSGRDALPPEQRALQQLLAADAIFRETQVAFGNQDGGGGGGRESNELTDLMELELDKMKNQYETLQREQRQRSEQAKTDAERRLEELARRQQQALEQQRRQQQQGQPRNGGGGGSQRQQQEMIEEARRAARELERLSRERRDARLQEMSRQMNQAADEMQRSQASSSNNNSNESIAQGERALERLEQARRRLQQMRGGGGGSQQGREQEIGELRRRAAEAATRQREIARDVENLARRGGRGGQDEASRASRERLAERKDALADSVGNLEQDIEQSARALGGGQQQQQRGARQLSEAAESLRRNRVAERIREGKRSLENNQPEAARAGERAVERSLDELSERLQAAESAAGRSAGSGAEESLDRARRLADDLESLRRRLDDRAARSDGRAGQQQRQQQQGSGQGRQQQQGSQSQAGQQAQGGQRSQQGSQTGGGGGEWGDARQLDAELRERLREAEDLRREWGGTTGSPVRELGRAVEELRRLADGSMRGDAQTAAALKAQVIDPLRQLELDLSRRLREQHGRTNLRLGDEGAAPERYRKSVEEYYRRLSQGGRR